MSHPARKLFTLRDTLRAGTAEQHEALEATPVMRAFDAAALDEHTARSYLTRQYVLHRALEQALAPHVPPAMARLRLQRSAWLADDLREFGFTVDEPEPAVPDVRGRADALGVLYVLEGSTLGLRMVRNRLQRDGVTGWPLASRFVQGYGDASGHHWLGLLAELEALPTSDWPAALAAAQATFTAFLTVFAEPADD